MKNTEKTVIIVLAIVFIIVIIYGSLPTEQKSTPITNSSIVQTDAIYINKGQYYFAKAVLRGIWLINFYIDLDKYGAWLANGKKTTSKSAYTCLQVLLRSPCTYYVCDSSYLGYKAQTKVAVPSSGCSTGLCCVYIKYPQKTKYL